MTNENRQRALLMAQLEKKRSLKQKYLHPKEKPEHGLTDLVMTNVMLLSIKSKADIFTTIRRLREDTDPYGTADFDTALGWIQSLADSLDCSVYELFITDNSKNRRILDKLLHDLSSCDSWQNIQLDEQENGSFALPGFDYAYRMSEHPSATLLFEKSAVNERQFRYTLTLGDGRVSAAPIPSQGVLWQETQGPLQEFTDRVLTELNSGWLPLKEQLDQIRQLLLQETDKFRDLTLLLKEAPAGMNLTSLLRRETALIKDLREKVKIVYDHMPEKVKCCERGKQVLDTLVLLGGAIQALEQLLLSGRQAPLEQLNEVVYMLENACEPL